MLDGYRKHFGFKRKSHLWLTFFSSKYSFSKKGISFLTSPSWQEFDSPSESPPVLPGENKENGAFMMIGPSFF